MAAQLLSASMAGVETELSREIARIAACQYPPSLTVSEEQYSIAYSARPALDSSIYAVCCATKAHESSRMQAAIADMRESRN